MTSLFTADYKNQPYWWDAAPRPAADTQSLPTNIDVLIIGAGYTGLMAGIQTARGGRSTLIIDAEAAGWGCSSRNGGQVSTSIKPSFSELSGRHNEETAFAIRQEGIRALDYIGELIRSEGLDCDWEQVGRFHAAHSERQFAGLVRGAENQTKGLQVPVEIVTRAEQRREIGSDYYHGGLVYPKHAALHPGKYHLELLRLARQAGVRVISHCAARNIERQGSGFRITTAHGLVRARDVVIATNGYTGPLSPWQRRRVIPIGSYIIATEPLDQKVAQDVAPTNRVMSDSRRVVFYYRLSPDKRRMLFGGRVAFSETDPQVSAPRLHHWMSGIFPQLAQSKISHSWMGFVAYTFDTLPHIGTQDGLHYCMGYCGSGVSLATYFGMRLGQKVLGSAEGETALDNVPFQTRPLYSGDPWFLAPSVMWYRFLDSLPI